MSVTAAPPAPPRPPVRPGAMEAHRKPDFGRRRFLGGAGASAALLGLSACGVAESEGDDGESGNSGRTRDVRAENGVIEVPEHPRRVIATENWTALMLYDVGLVPVGMPDGIANPSGLPRDVYHRLKSAKSIGPAGSPDAQSVGALKPDLIVDQFYKAKTAGLKKIAPVVYYNWTDSGSLWHEQVDKVADAVNRKDKLADTKRTYRARLDEVRKKYRSAIAGTTWAPLSGGQKGVFFLGSPLLTVMRDLGLKIGAGIPKKEAGFVEKSYEELDVLDGCDVLLYPELFDGKPPPLTGQLLDNRLWKRLPAVRDGHAFAFQHYAVGSYRWAHGAVDEIEKILKKL